MLRLGKKQSKMGNIIVQSITHPYSHLCVMWYRLYSEKKNTEKAKKRDGLVPLPYKQGIHILGILNLQEEMWV